MLLTLDSLLLEDMFAQYVAQNVQPALDRAQGDVDRLSESNNELRARNAAQAERIAELLKERGK